MNEPAENLAKLIIDQSGRDRRFIVAIVGAPGAGKSTFAATLKKALNRGGLRRAEVLAMDGFHLDNTMLRARGTLDRKGAPDTFDLVTFAAILTQIKSVDGDVKVPVFDRENDRVRADACVIASSVRVVIVEGNYLLLDHPDWVQMARVYDLSVFLEVPRFVLQERLIKRWRDLGLDAKAARSRAIGNDMVNVDIVLNQSLPADVRLSMVGPSP